MTRGTPHKKRIQGNFLVPLFLILFVLLCFLPWKQQLVISDYRANKTLLVLPLEPGETFSIRFTHSLNLSDVTDTLEWTGETLILRESRFSAFGAGIPVPAEGIGETLVNTPDGFVLSGIDAAQADNALLIMLQSVPDHRLLYRDRELSLLAMSHSGALLKLCVRPVSVFEMIVY